MTSKKQLTIALALAATIAVVTVSMMQQGAGPRLTIQKATLTNTPCMEWFSVIPATTSQLGSTGQVKVVCYTGPAFILCATGLNQTQSMFVQCSVDLSNWSDFPAPNFQLTLTNGECFDGILAGSWMFFRGVVR